MDKEKSQRIFERDKKLFAQGSEYALCDALMLCFQFRRSIPEWAAKACMTRLSLIANGEEKKVLKIIRTHQKLSKHIARSIVFEENLIKEKSWKRALRTSIKALANEGIEENATYDSIKESAILLRSSKSTSISALSRKNVRGKVKRTFR